MNELISVNYDNPERSVVSGRELHTALGIKTAYKDWFPRMCEYGFTENSDFLTVAQKRATAQGNYTTYNDHMLTIPMAIERAGRKRLKIRYFTEEMEEKK